MSIDRIGKPNGLAGVIPAETGPISPSSVSTGEAFKVLGATPTQAPTALERLRAGEISLSRYLDERVESATQHLVGRLSAEQLEFIHENLREQLATDPVLSDLVHAASGGAPTHE